MLRKFTLGILLIFCLMFFQAAPALAQADNTQQQINSGLCAGVNLDVNNPDCNTVNTAAEQINAFIRSAINLLSIIVGVVAVTMIIIGGLRYITSGGSDTGVTSAKNTILYAIIGLIIVALAQIIVRFVLKQVTG
ncbi:MAG TPA: pilin [Candidatus Saccharimonadales bacterium]|nr:pilin [Candidatus Saccharimonadales bacterium]